MDVALPFVLKSVLENKLKVGGLVWFFFWEGGWFILIIFKIQSNFSCTKFLHCGTSQALSDPLAVHMLHLHIQRLN